MQRVHLVVPERQLQVRNLIALLIGAPGSSYKSSSTEFRELKICSFLHDLQQLSEIIRWNEDVARSRVENCCSRVAMDFIFNRSFRSIDSSKISHVNTPVPRNTQVLPVHGRVGTSILLKVVAANYEARAFGKTAIVWWPLNSLISLFLEVISYVETKNLLLYGSIVLEIFHEQRGVRVLR